MDTLQPHGEGPQDQRQLSRLHLPLSLKLVRIEIIKTEQGATGGQRKLALNPRGNRTEPIRPPAIPGRLRHSGFARAIAWQGRYRSWLAPVTGVAPAPRTGGYKDRILAQETGNFAPFSRLTPPVWLLNPGGLLSVLPEPPGYGARDKCHRDSGALAPRVAPAPHPWPGPCPGPNPRHGQAGWGDGNPGPLRPC